jgi:hypothetical protein
MGAGLFDGRGIGRAEADSVGRRQILYGRGTGRAEPDFVARRQKARFLPAALDVHSSARAGRR